MNDRLTKALQDATKNIESEAYIFSKNDGTPFASIQTSFEKAVKKAGIKGLTIKVMRS
jgi:hypothetical protein